MGRRRSRRSPCEKEQTEGLRRGKRTKIGAQSMGKRSAGHANKLQREVPPRKYLFVKTTCLGPRRPQHPLYVDA